MDRASAFGALACLALGGAAFAQQAGTGSRSDGEPSPSVRATDLLGAAVHSHGGREIGELQDLVIEDGAVVAAVIALGGVIDAGEKQVSVPFEELTAGNDPGTLSLGRTESQLEALPQFDAASASAGTEAPVAGSQHEPLEVDEELAEIDPRLAAGVAANEEAYDEEIDPESHDIDDGREDR